MASKAALSRLAKEYQRILADSVENVEARPAADSLLVWHYVVQGPKGSPYQGQSKHCS
jgi:ubiquitin-conjugating enzyme E2 J2